MALKTDLEVLKKRKNPTFDDYRKLLDFASELLNLLQKERKAKSALNKKNRKMASLLRLNNKEVM